MAAKKIAKIDYWTGTIGHTAKSSAYPKKGILSPHPSTKPAYVAKKAKMSKAKTVD